MINGWRFLQFHPIKCTLQRRIARERRRWRKKEIYERGRKEEEESIKFCSFIFLPVPSFHFPSFSLYPFIISLSSHTWWNSINVHFVYNSNITASISSLESWNWIPWHEEEKEGRRWGDTISNQVNKVKRKKWKREKALGDHLVTSLMIMMRQHTHSKCVREGITARTISGKPRISERTMRKQKNSSTQSYTAQYIIVILSYKTHFEWFWKRKKRVEHFLKWHLQPI